MYFKRLEIQGFKSFAEPISIEFDKGITCIVGPNGSGKSNICDAIRWVLGEQSSKTLRGDKMEDVIFAGTANRRSRGMAEVSLVIDNSEGDLDIDYREVEITRRMYRSGESEYLINNNQCRMKDIRELIMDTGIGVEGYSMIGQGKISDIISNKTESIREILEETAGIVSYRSKKAEAERKLESASANMERVNDIISEIEGRIGSLKEESEKAGEYITLRDRHKELEINITLKSIESIKQKSAEAESDIDQLGVQLGELRQRREAVSLDIEEKTSRRNQLDGLIDSERAVQSETTESINRIESRQKVRAERLSAIEKDEERLIREIGELEERTKAEEEKAEKLLGEKEAIEEKMDAAESELGERNSSWQSAADSLKAKQNVIDDMKKDLFDLQTSISSRASEISSMEALAGSLVKRKNEILSEKGEKDEQESSDRRELSGAISGKKKIEDDISSLKEKKGRLEEEKSGKISMTRKLSDELEDIKMEIGRIHSRKRTIEEMEANYEGYNAAVRHVMQKKKDGICGVVAELIDVPDGLEVAMETAFGQSLQNIVCEKASDASEAIEDLKQSRAGRSTFLPLDSVRPRGVDPEKKLEKMHGFRGYGSECISFSERYSPVIEYLIGNVIVTDSLDDAIAMSKTQQGRWKFVSLEGDIINVGGAMTGGRYKNKTANILERKAEIEKMNEKIAGLEKEKKDGDAKLEELAEKAAALDKELSGISEKLSSLQGEKFACESRISLLEASISDSEEGEERRRKELARIADEEEKYGASVESIRTAIDEDTSKAEDMKKTIGQLEEAYDKEKAGTDSAASDITEARIRISGMKSEAEKAEALYTAARTAADGFADDGDAKKAELTGLSQEKERLSGSDIEIQSEAEEKKRALSEIGARLSAYAEERSRLVSELDEGQRQREEFDREINVLQDQKYDMDVRAARAETQLENAKNKLWDEFEVSYMQALDMRNDSISISAAVKENREIKRRMKELGEVNIGSIKEYETVSERYEFLTSQRQDIEKSKDELMKIISDMDRIIRSRFKESFDQVVVNFEEVFKDFYGGGHARIALEDESDPFNSEIEIIAQPPGKQLKHINLLSGGEKTMTAIALMFAVLKTKPTPYCILDEVEAALDDRNLEIFGDYLKEFEGVQFTLITHQKTTMEHADIMYGITMPESGVSKIYSLRMGDSPLM